MKLQKIKTWKEMQAQETLFGLAYNDRRGEEKWVFNTPTWEVFSWRFMAPNGQHLLFSDANLQKTSKQSLLEKLQKWLEKLNNFC